MLDDEEYDDEDREEEHVFTLSEARSLIPKLRRLLSRVVLEREALLDLRIEIDRARERAELSGGSFAGPAYLKHLTAFSEAVQEVQSLGVLIKDFRTGLVDFPYEHHGRIIYLCWRLGEDEIEWWHEVEAGFAGRQPLTDDFE